MDYDPEIFKAFAWYSAVVLGKTLAMSTFTAIKRFANKAMANPEDAKGLHVKVTTNEEVERVRRCHLNDLENVFPFVMIAYFYVTRTNPTMSAALLHFRLFTYSRLAHTAVYLGAVPQPARAILHLIGYFANIHMLYKILTA